MSQEFIQLSSLLCGLCQQVLNQPQISLCGHSYCNGCVIKLGSICSTCEYQISSFTVKNYAVAGIIETIRSRFTTKQDLMLQIECSLCKELYDSPMTINCGHTFCYTCCFQVKFTSRTCPICRSVIWRIRSNCALEHLIEEVKNAKGSSGLTLTS